uniref:Gamma-aminobutyric acid receptor subunit beta n=1 Tax=Crassostrea virginica TaxID=6565 RepID=A0A8B8DI15_CRAVI|nr:glycine receptor subunit alpha-2-like [Crassostrea virginica]XP_022328182.1 glycine receptor subunit alpha-2-like [Crassostrea virginica]
MRTACTNLWVFLTLIQAIKAQNLQRRDILNLLLNSSTYDPRIPPDYEKDVATDVNVQLFVTSIDSINAVAMDYTLHLFLRQTWTDSRLNFSHLTNISVLELDQKRISDVWVPDTYFPNEKTASFHTVTVPNKLLHIQKDGYVIYSVRLSLTLSCIMELQYFPMDDQTCSLFIESYGYSIENVNLLWDYKQPVIFGADDNNEQTMPQFYFYKELETFGCTTTNAFNTEFSCLQAKLYFRRNLGFYLSQVFIPGILIVILSWISFWIHVDAVPARVSLGVICVLTMTTQSSGIRSSLPVVSYIKAIDIWMAVGLLFVFAALLEYAYINVQTRKHRKQSKEHEPEGKNENDDKTDFMVRALRVDRLSRVIFPVCYTAFNLIFWIVYLSK